MAGSEERAMYMKTGMAAALLWAACMAGGAGYGAACVPEQGWSVPCGRAGALEMPGLREDAARSRPAGVFVQMAQAREELLRAQDTLQEEMARLTAVRESLERERAALAGEKSDLEAERASVKTPKEVRVYGEKMRDFNRRVDEYLRKSEAYSRQADEFNALTETLKRR